MALVLQPSPQTLSPRPPTAHRSPPRAEPTLMGLTHRQTPLSEPPHDRAARAASAASRGKQGGSGGRTVCTTTQTRVGATVGLNEPVSRARCPVVPDDTSGPQPATTERSRSCAFVDRLGHLPGAPAPRATCREKQGHRPGVLGGSMALATPPGGFREARLARNRILRTRKSTD
jgi:hypothetical protein